MKPKISLLSIALLWISSSYAQQFMSGLDRFSSSKPAYLTLNDGTKVEGTIDDLDRKKGNLIEITLKSDKKKTSYKPNQIKEMYLPGTALGIMNKKIEAGTNVTKKLDMDRVSDGYVYFENTEVELKGKVMPLLMQLVNVGFHDKIRVYFDPWATETMSIGFGPLKAGGIDRSYFIKVGDKPAYKITKPEYEKGDAKKLFADCPQVINALKDSDEWNKFERMVYMHYECK